MIYQSNKKLHPDLQKWGCYFLSIIRIFEKESKTEVDVEQVNRVYDLSKAMGYVGDEAYIIKDAIKGIIQVASGIAIGNVYMKRVTIDDDYNYVIAKFSRTTNSGKKVSHFCLMKDPKVVEYDPWSEEGSRTAKIGHIESYRYIIAEAV